MTEKELPYLLYTVNTNQYLGKGYEWISHPVYGKFMNSIINEIYGKIFILLFAFFHYSLNPIDHFGKDQERHVSKSDI